MYPLQVHWKIIKFSKQGHYRFFVFPIMVEFKNKPSYWFSGRFVLSLAKLDYDTIMVTRNTVLYSLVFSEFHLEQIQMLNAICTSTSDKLVYEQKCSQPQFKTICYH